MGAGTAGTGRIAGCGFAEDGVVAGLQVLDVAGGQRLKVLVLVLADHSISLAQQHDHKRDHIGCPRLARGPLSAGAGLAPRTW